MFENWPKGIEHLHFDTSLFNQPVAENFLLSDMEVYTDFIKDPNCSSEDKTLAIQELLKHPSGFDWLKNIFKTSNAEISMEDKIFIMKTCMEKSDYFRDWLRDLYWLNDAIEEVPDGNYIKEKVKKCMEDKDIVKFLNGSMQNLINNTQTEYIRKRQKELNKNGSNLPLCEAYISAIQKAFGEKLKKLDVPQAFISYLWKNLFNQIVAEKYVTKGNIIDMEKMRNDFSWIISLVDQFIQQKSNKKEKIQLDRDAKESILPELYLIRCLSYWKNESDVLNFENNFIEYFKKLNCKKDLHITQYRSTTEKSQDFKKWINYILQNFGREVIDDETYKYNIYLAEIKEKKNEVPFIVEPEEYAVYTEEWKKQIKSLYNWLQDTGKLGGMDDIGDVRWLILSSSSATKWIDADVYQSIMEKLSFGDDAEINSQDVLWILKTYSMTLWEKKTFSESDFQEFILNSKCKWKTNFIKFYLDQLWINIPNIDEFFTNLNDETNSVLAKKFSELNDWINPNDIINEILELALENAKKQRDWEKILNILTVPFCNVDWKPFKYHLDFDTEKNKRNFINYVKQNTSSQANFLYNWIWNIICNDFWNTDQRQNKGYKTPNPCTEEIRIGGKERLLIKHKNWEYYIRHYVSEDEHWKDGKTESYSNRINTEY